MSFEKYPLNERYRDHHGRQLRAFALLRRVLPKRKSRGLTFRRFFRFLLLMMVFGTLASSLVLVFLLAWFSQDLPNPGDLIKREIPQTTKIYDRTGEQLLYEIHGDENRTLVKLDDIPKYARAAAILLEDKEFYSHKGLSWRGFARVALNPVLCRLSPARFCRSGGSTITQQLVKNAILTPERTVARKIKEIILTLELERRFSKDEILELYFNEIPYGSSNYGIQSASRSFFGKSVKDLTISEAATLAALPRAPTAYLNDLGKLKSRRNRAVELLAEQGEITYKQADLAEAEPVAIQARSAGMVAPHFVDHVREELEAKYGVRKVEQGGLKVITTLDLAKQKIAEEEVKKGVEQNGKKFKLTNAALVALDPKTGQVLAMVGSKDYFEPGNGQFNIVTKARRQPGSSMKPVIYAAAFARGFPPSTILWDVDTIFPVQPKPYQPVDYDGKEHGPMNLRTALQGSINIPAVKLMYLVGVRESLDFARTLGYTTLGTEANIGLSLVLGGGGVNFLEHVGAYATFADEGLRRPTASVLKIEDALGATLYKWEDTSVRVLDENIARTLTDVLADNNARAFMFGQNSPLQIQGRPVAAKTGTTNNYVDAWTLGYTPSLAVGVWAGNNDNTPMNRAGGTLAAAPIWNGFMKRTLADQPVEPFTAPSALPATKPVLAGYPSEAVPGSAGAPERQPSLTLNDGRLIKNYGVCTPATIDRASGKLATSYTPTTFRETRFFCDVHEILHYIDRLDPLGADPERPEDDPMYAAFEDSVKRFLEKNGVVPASIPNEHDDAHLPASAPFIQLTSHENGANIENRSVTFSAEARGTRPISRVEFWIDEVKVGSARTVPFTATVTLANRVPVGMRALRAIAFDDIDNSAEARVEINVTAPIIPIPVAITAPPQETVIHDKQFPFALKVVSGGEFYALDLYVGKPGTGEILAGTQFAPAGTQIVTWNQIPKEKGRYSLRIRARESGDIYSWSEPVFVNVE